MADISKLEQQAQLLANNLSGWENSTLQRIGKRISRYGKMSIADVKSINNIAVVKQDIALSQIKSLKVQSQPQHNLIYLTQIQQNVVKVNIKQQVVIVGNMLKKEQNNMIDTEQMAKYIFEEYANCYSEVDIKKLAKHLEEIKAEAYKEFAERLKNEIINDTAYACDSTQHSGYYDYQIKIGDIPEYIDNLVKEMEGDSNE